MGSDPGQPVKVGTVSGYLHPTYAESLAEFGTPRELPRCRGWILERQVPGFSYRDAMGCYPLFACQDWSELRSDLEGLRNQLISLSLVTDPFGEYDPACLRRCFDVLIPFKEHFVSDLSRDMNTFISDHHRRYARKALREVQIERCQNPEQFTDEWMDLYTNLVDRHGIEGLAAFSRTSFAKQLKVPGMVMFRAVHQGTTVGMTLWYTQGDVGYYHLGAYSEAGYQLRASFALFWRTIEYLAGNDLRWLNLGANAGTASKSMDGLSRFKQGWSTGTRTAYFCGRVLDPQKYSEIAHERGISATDYFPSYRKGEFG